jgi:hypothetical protein
VESAEHEEGGDGAAGADNRDAKALREHRSGVYQC